MSFLKFTLSIFILISCNLSSLLFAEGFRDSKAYATFVENKRHFTFDIDHNNDGFPDPWFLEKGEPFQDYHSILIDNSDGYDGPSSLRVLFLGGSAGVKTAALKLDPRFAYNIRLAFRSKGLVEKHQPILEFGLVCFDDQLHEIDRFILHEVPTQQEWSLSKTLRVEQLPEKTSSSRLFIHLYSRPTGRSTLWLDDVLITATPRILVSTERMLNIFSKGEDMIFKQKIEGTQPGQTYVLKTVIKDFMQQVIQPASEELKGQEEALIREGRIPVKDQELSGVFYVYSSLIHEGRELTSVKEIVARDAGSGMQLTNPSFGVLLGRPNPPFNKLTYSMQRLGVSISKLDLFPKPFSFASFDKEKGLVDLNDLLLREALDKGIKFIGVLNEIPTESKDHVQFRINNATHPIQTFATHTDQWLALIDRLLFLYSSSITDWQVGLDHQSVNMADVSKGEKVLKAISGKASWSTILLPSETLRDGASIYVPADMSLDQLKERILESKASNLYVTVQLDTELSLDPLQILENLVKKVTFLKSILDDSGSPRITKIFIDRLNDPYRGLMTKNYQPNSAFFAVKTLAEWFQDSTFLGSFTLPDKQVTNFAFARGDKAFVILWRETETQDVGLWLGDELVQMDLMGNQTPAVVVDHVHTQHLGSTPIFLISPYPELFRTILSYALINNNLQSLVQLQNQKAKITNAFSEQAKLNFSVNYPSDWIIQGGVFDLEIPPSQSAESSMELAPSSLSPAGSVPVYTDVEISLKQKRHQVKIFREDHLSTDVNISLRFYREGQDLKVDIGMQLDASAPKPSSFSVSAHFMNGDMLEAFFKDIGPGQMSRQSLYLRQGLSRVGEVVSLEAKERLGSRHINQSFTVKLEY